MKRYRKKSKKTKKLLKEISTLESLNFDKTLVVGHEFSNYEKVYNLLRDIGMSDTKKDFPQDISKKILDSHGKIGEYENQLDVQRIWESLALDLFLKNRHQRWWGWQDSQAVTLLEYWSRLDAKLSFVLVYCSPKDFLSTYLKNYKFEQEDVKYLVAEWYKYNKLLLEFFYKNQSRSLMVNSKRINQDHHIYLQQVQKQVGKIGNTTQVKENEVVNVEEISTNSQEKDQLVDFFLEMYFSQKPELNELYTELQSIANVPMIEEQESRDFTPLNAIEELLNKEKLHKKAKKRVHKLSNKIGNIKREKEELESTLQKVEGEYNFTKKSVQEKELENEELLNQLMGVQEELEKYYLENNLTKKETEEALQKMQQLSLEIEKQKQELNKTKSLNNIAQTTIESLKTEHKKIKQLLETKESIEAKYNKTQTVVQEKELENEELLTQLMSVQEELEKYYLEAQNLKNKIEEKKRY